MRYILIMQNSIAQKEILDHSYDNDTSGKCHIKIQNMIKYRNYDNE